MESEKIVFSSEKEKKEYLEYLDSCHNSEKAYPFKTTWEIIKKRTNKIKKDGLSMPELLLYGLICIVHLAFVISGTEMSLLFNIVGRIASLECIWQINKGLYCAIIPSIIISPFIFGYNSIRRIVQDIKFSSKKKKVKESSVIVADDYENKKNSKSEILESLLDTFDKEKEGYWAKDYYQSLADSTLKADEVKKLILEVNDPMMKEAYSNSLLAICSFLVRATKLKEEKNREDAFKFGLEQLRNMEKNVNTQVDFEKQKKSLEQGNSTIDDRYVGTLYLKR